MDLFPPILQVQLNAKTIQAAGLEVPACVGEMSDAALDGVGRALRPAPGWPVPPAREAIVAAGQRQRCSS